MRDCFVDELFELIRQEEEIIENYNLAEKVKIQHRLRFEALTRKSEEWIYHCFVGDITELKNQDSVILKGMIREYELRKALQINDIVEKCKSLLVLSLFRLRIEVPLIGVMGFGKVTACPNGLLMHDFNHNHPPTKMMFIYLIHSRNHDILGSMSWKHGSVEPQFHVFLHCSTIIRCFSSPDESVVTLKDCRWPILKEIEKSHGICANCSRHGHTSDKCQYKFCMRCGRKGHIINDCFASKNILNESLQSFREYSRLFERRRKMLYFNKSIPETGILSLFSDDNKANSCVQ